MSKPIWCFFGAVALILGIVGIVLPLLPTTPFILLSCACFSRGSERLHHWLISHPRFGPVIVNWQEHRSLSPVVKKRALVMIVLSFAFSIYMMPLPAVKSAVGVMGVVLFIWIYRLPEREAIAPYEESGKI
ncbi:YbaN family protein [Thaumasiovibrio subtropicus]|uniref:YbaN family protein n=1 Tax=Thaumasiovibrio subtropicus TaxID=1891207 RepID=UPI001FEC724A|nr:YbaN family protein [Thaumasiovibrio subtropicus]